VAAINALPNWLLVPKVTFLPSIVQILLMPRRSKFSDAQTAQILICSDAAKAQRL
jgi:hypothetical protein